MKKVIVVGAGIGGLSTAIRLLDKGYRVTIFEKESTVGGKVNVKEERGFRFDLTASILMTPDIYTEIFESVGKDYREYFELINLDPIYKVNYYDGSEYKFYSNLLNMTSTLEIMEEGLSTEYVNFLYTSLNRYLISKEYFLNEPMLSKKELINMKSIQKILSINPLTTASNYISNLIHNEKLIDYLMFQSMYIGINPYTNSSLYSIIPTISHIYGLYYIKGGFYKYVEALEKLLYELGGKIYKDTCVEKILVNKNKIEGVKYNGKEYKADIVICNADFPYAIESLFNTDMDEGRFKSKNIDKKEYSYSTFIIYLGLKKKYENLEVHNIYINKEFRQGIEGPFKGNMPESPSLYIYYPSKVDNSLCEGEKATMNIILRVPNLKVGNINWDKETVINIRNKIISEIKKIEGLEDIEESIEYEDYLTPVGLQGRFNAYKGNAFGLSHKISQSIYLRPNIKSKGINGLYYIGSSTHPGNGVSIILDGSKLVSDLISIEH